MSLELEAIQSLIGNQNAMIAKQNKMIEQQTRVMGQLLDATSALLEALDGPLEDGEDDNENFGYDLSGKPIRN